jgi:hypothetical protein
MHLTRRSIVKFSGLSGATSTGDGQQEEQGRSVKKAVVGKNDSIGDADAGRIGIDNAVKYWTSRKDGLNRKPGQVGDSDI